MFFMVPRIHNPEWEIGSYRPYLCNYLGNQQTMAWMQCMTKAVGDSSKRHMSFQTLSQCEPISYN